MSKRRNFVRICTPKEFVDVINHNNYEFEQRISKIARQNRKLSFLACIATGYAVYAYLECRKQEDKINQLSLKVKALETVEEE